MQVFPIAWCCWKKTCLNIKLLFISLCLQHFIPREEFPSASQSFTSRYILTYLQRLLKNIRINILKMSNLSFNSSVQLYVGRGKEVSISILSSSISSFIILFMKNQSYLEIDNSLFLWCSAFLTHFSGAPVLPVKGHWNLDPTPLLKGLYWPWKCGTVMF